METKRVSIVDELEGLIQKIKEVHSKRITIDLLITDIEDLKVKLNIPEYISEINVNELEFFEKLDSMSRLAFDDQSPNTDENPIRPLISEIKKMYIKAFMEKL